MNLPAHISDTTLDSRLTQPPNGPPGANWPTNPSDGLPLFTEPGPSHPLKLRERAMEFSVQINLNGLPGVDKVVSDAEKIFNYITKGEVPAPDGKKPNAFIHKGA